MGSQSQTQLSTHKGGSILLCLPACPHVQKNTVDSSPPKEDSVFTSDPWPPPRVGTGTDARVCPHQPWSGSVPQNYCDGPGVAFLGEPLPTAPICHYLSTPESPRPSSEADSLQDRSVPMLTQSCGSVCVKFVQEKQLEGNGGGEMEESRTFKGTRKRMLFSDYKSRSEKC